MFFNALTNQLPTHLDAVSLQIADIFASGKKRATRHQQDDPANTIQALLKFCLTESADNILMASRDNNRKDFSLSLDGFSGGKVVPLLIGLLGMKRYSKKTRLVLEAIFNRSAPQQDNPYPASAASIAKLIADKHCVDISPRTVGGTIAMPGFSRVFEKTSGKRGAMGNISNSYQITDPARRFSMIIMLAYRQGLSLEAIRQIADLVKPLIWGERLASVSESIAPGVMPPANYHAQDSVIPLAKSVDKHPVDYSKLHMGKQDNRTVYPKIPLIFSPLCIPNKTLKTLKDFNKRSAVAVPLNQSQKQIQGTTSGQAEYEKIQEAIALQEAKQKRRATMKRQQNKWARDRRKGMELRGVARVRKEPEPVAQPVEKSEPVARPVEPPVSRSSATHVSGLLDSLLPWRRKRTPRLSCKGHSVD